MAGSSRWVTRRDTAQLALGDLRGRRDGGRARCPTRSGRSESRTHAAAQRAGPARPASTGARPVRAAWLARRWPGPRRAARAATSSSGWAGTRRWARRRGLARSRTSHGPEAVFGGSYGWARAGRFHHAQSQVHRFLNVLGGDALGAPTASAPPARCCVTSSGTTRRSAADDVPVLAEHAGLFLCSAACRPRTRRSTRAVPAAPTAQAAARGPRRGAQFVLVPPLRDDLAGDFDAEWPPGARHRHRAAARPGASLSATGGTTRCSCTHCTGSTSAPTFAGDRRRARSRLGGASAGSPRSGSSRWPGDAAHRTMMTLSWSLQRARHGERRCGRVSPWRACSARSGCPAGVRNGYGSTAGSAGPGSSARCRPCRRGHAVEEHPGGAHRRHAAPPRRGVRLRRHPAALPRLRLVYWAGGNPFHHHQDLARLRRAFPGRRR